MDETILVKRPRKTPFGPTSGLLMTVLALSVTWVSPLSALSAVPDFLRIRLALGLDWRLIDSEMEAINHKMVLDPILSEVGHPGS